MTSGWGGRGAERPAHSSVPTRKPQLGPVVHPSAARVGKPVLAGGANGSLRSPFTPATPFTTTAPRSVIMRHVPVVTTSDRPSHPSQAPALVSSAPPPPPPSSMAAAPATAPRSAAAAVQRRRCRRCRRRCRRPHSKRDSAEPSEPSGGPLSWHFRRSNFLRTARRPTSIDSLLRPPCTYIYIYKKYIRQVKPIDRLSRKS